MKIKTIIAAIATLSISLASCSKDDRELVVPPISGLNIIHASPTTEKLDFYVDGTRANNVDFAFGNKMGYFSLYSGKRRLITVKKNTTTPLLVSEDLTLEDQKAYSLFIYDKFDALKYLFVKDDLTAPASGKAKLRFVHLSPDAPELSLSIAGKDADLFSGKAFKSYTDFTEIDPAAKVTFHVENADGSVTATLADIKIEAGKIYTVWVKGLKAAADDTKLGIAVFEHK